MSTFTKVIEAIQSPIYSDNLIILINIVALFLAIYLCGKIINKKRYIDYLFPVSGSFVAILLSIFIYCLLQHYYFLLVISAVIQIIWLYIIAMNYFYYKNNTDPYTNLIGITAEDIIDNLPGHIYWKNKNGICLGSNKYQYLDLGYNSKNELIGKTDYDVFTDSKIVPIRSC